MQELSVYTVTGNIVFVPVWRVEVSRVGDEKETGEKDETPEQSSSAAAPLSITIYGDQGHTKLYKIGPDEKVKEEEKEKEEVKDGEDESGKDKGADKAENVKEESKDEAKDEETDKTEESDGKKDSKKEIYDVSVALGT